MWKINLTILALFLVFHVAHAAPTTTFIAATSTPGCLAVTTSGLLWSNGSDCGTGSGGGGGGGTWSTTTSTVVGQLINYPNNTTDIVTIGSNSTTSAQVYFDPNTNNSYFGGTMVIGTTTATSSANTAYVTIERPLSSVPGLRVIGGNSSNASLEVRSRDTGSLPGVIAILSDEYRQKGLTFKYASSTNTFSIFGDYYDSGPSSSLVLGTYEARTNQLVLTNNGRVGIGTTTPSAPLSIKTTSTGVVVPVLTINRQNLDTLAFELAINSASQPYFTANNADILFGKQVSGTYTEGMRLTTTGSLGIGTSSPISKLSVMGDLHLSGSSQDVSWRTGEAFQLGEYDGSTFTERLRILNTGFTGIGTTTPRQLLSVQGNALFSGNLSLANLTATGTLTVTSLADGCLNSTSGVIGSTGSACGSGGGSSVSTSTIAFTFDGGGVSLTEASTSFAWRSIPVGSTIKSWTLTGDLVGSTTIHVAKSTYANYPGYALIDGSDIPQMINAQKNTSTALTGWTTALSTGDIIYAFVSGEATTTTKAVLNIDITTP